MGKALTISRRNFIRSTSVAAAGLAVGATEKAFARASEDEKHKQPHIILIMTDQQRFDALGCMGNPSVISPNIDKLAQQGVVFRNGYSSTPSCTPARAGLLTGMSPWHHGMLGYGRVARKYSFEMPQMLRNAGYYTFGIGKMHWFPQKSLHGFHGTLVDESGRVEQDGFVSDYHDWFKLQSPGSDPNATGIGWNEHRAGTYKLSEKLHPTYWTGKTAVEFINNYQLEQPLFLKISFARPHSPYDPPKRLLEKYNNIEIPEPWIGDWCQEFASYPDTPDAAFGNFGTEHAVKARRHYYANITFIDEQVGQIIDALKQKGLYNDALICFTADHGDMLGDHYHWRKTYAYEGSSHIPFILQWPEWMNAQVKRGSELEQAVGLRDWLPTFLDAASVPVPDKMDGRSMLSLLRKQNPEWREYLDLEHAATYRPENYWSALTDGKVKYIWFFRTGEEQLFDLVNDPGEKHELHADPSWQSELKKWRNRMVQHLSERGKGFVQDGQLVKRKENLLYSPNYPAS